MLHPHPGTFGAVLALYYRKNGAPFRFNVFARQVHQVDHQVRFARLAFDRVRVYNRLFDRQAVSEKSRRNLEF